MQKKWERSQKVRGYFRERNRCFYVFDCYLCIWPFPRLRLILSLKMEQFWIVSSYVSYMDMLSVIPIGFWMVNVLINLRISKFEVVWINCYLTIVITYKTHWHNDISAVKTLFSQHLFTCNLCKIVLKYDLFGRHVKTFMLCLSFLFFAHHVSSLVWSTSGPFKGFGL